MRTRHASIVAVLLLMVLVAGCSRAPTPEPTPTPQASVTATPAVTPTPTPTVAVTPGQPIPQVVQDVVLAGVANEPARMAALAKYQQVACTTAQGAGGPPKCPPGTAAGTSMRVFATGACEGEWAEDAAGAIARLMARPLQLYAAAQVRVPSPDPEPIWPKGQYVVVFSASAPATGSPSTVYFVLDGANVLRAHATCDSAPGGEAALLRTLGVTSYLIAPR
ncbi:MAG: hypothetical protein WC211_07940 [Dehalococcoidia bacterium]